MSMDVYVKTGELSSGLLRRAIRETEDAYEKAKKALNDSEMYFYWEIGGKNVYLYPTDAQYAILSAMDELQTAYKRLKKLASILDSDPDAMADIDEASKKEFPSDWQRFCSGIAAAGVAIGGFIGGLWDNLFTKGGGNTGSAVSLSELYADVAEEFDWSKTSATEAQISAAIVAGANSGKSSSNADQAVREELQKLYNETKLTSFSDESIHAYSEGVSRGTIRYCNQIGELADKNGWAPQHSDSDEGKRRPACESMCNRACESMALSYLGIDQSPSSMQDNANIKAFEFAASGVKNGHTGDLQAVDGTATVKITGGYYKNSFDRNALDNLVTRFEEDNGQGVHSPVLLHYDKWVGEEYHSHWILIIGRNEDGTYKAIGPWSNTGTDFERIPFTVTISDSGVVSGQGFSGSAEGRSVSHIGQYSRVD